LTGRDNRTCRLTDTKGENVSELSHHGIGGGGNVEARQNLEPKLLMGFFIIIGFLYLRFLSFMVG
jgi:hypothetical protein